MLKSRRYLLVNLLTTPKATEKSERIRQRVITAREVKLSRFKDFAGMYANAHITGILLKEFCVLDAASSNLLKIAMEKLNLSARAYDRILKVSRTIADLVSSESIKAEHVAEAIQYRSLDREGWAG